LQKILIQKRDDLMNGRVAPHLQAEKRSAYKGKDVLLFTILFRQGWNTPVGLLCLKD
jgi:hypothetical protein